MAVNMNIEEKIEILKSLKQDDVILYNEKMYYVIQNKIGDAVICRAVNEFDDYSTKIQLMLSYAHVNSDCNLIVLHGINTAYSAIKNKQDLGRYILDSVTYDMENKGLNFNIKKLAYSGIQNVNMKFVTGDSLPDDFFEPDESY